MACFVTINQAPARAACLLPALCAAFLLCSCAAPFDWQRRAAQRSQVHQAAAAHAEWRAATPAWKSQTFRNPAVLGRATPENVSVQIDLGDQRGLLLVDGSIAMDFPVATGKRSHPTPAGSFTILEKKREHASNLYGKIYDADGQLLVADADTRRHVVPEGGRFAAASMPNWMRLTYSGVGMHVGIVPGRPASHGCIRLRRDAADTVFNLVKIGTPVVVARRAPALGAP